MAFGARYYDMHLDWCERCQKWLGSARRRAEPSGIGLATREATLPSTDRCSVHEIPWWTVKLSSATSALCPGLSSTDLALERSTCESRWISGLRDGCTKSCRDYVVKQYSITV
eukprot:scpid62192/ scgid22266/ 